MLVMFREPYKELCLSVIRYNSGQDTAVKITLLLQSTFTNYKFYSLTCVA